MRTNKLLALATLLLASATARSEDIDLFAASSASNADNAPSILFVVDNTANWNAAFTNEKAALASVFANLPTNADGTAKVRIGIMFSNETGGGDNNIAGGYVRAAIRPMNTANKALYSSLIGSVHQLKDKGNAGQASLVMAEAHRYFTAGAPYAGNFKAKTDFTGNIGQDWSPSVTDAASLGAMLPVYALTGNALASKNAVVYNNSFTEGCGGTFIIYISNGPSQDNNSTRTTSRNLLQAAGGNTTTMALSPSGSQDNMADEWAKFMAASTLGVKTYTIDVNPGSTGQGPGWTRLLKNMATVSKGTYYSVNSANAGGAEIADAINGAISEIIAVNTVFASVSLPVSIDNQGIYLNQVYVGVFRPDGDSKPLWPGNLKHYKMGLSGSSNTLQLFDADNASAINSNTGFITECARSFWTPSAVDNYWAFAPFGGCVPSGNDPDAYARSNSPDGNIVEKGGQAYRLRAINTPSSSRNVKTCSPSFGSCSSLTNFDNSNNDISESQLGAADNTERLDLIAWARGIDNKDENANGNVAEMRPSSHSDVIHSRPVAVNFGAAAGSPQVVVFYGANDGILRAVNGNRTASIGTAAPGDEMWSFVAPEYWSKIKRTRDNTVKVKFPNQPTGEPKPYGVDGPIVAHRDGSDYWVYATMRRGGRSLYAFRAQMSGGNLNMQLMWKVGCPNNLDAAAASLGDDCTNAAFQYVGQSWSAPRIVNVASESQPLIIVGGGYDSCEDSDAHTCDGAHVKRGNRVYVLDAEDGSLVKTFVTDRAVAADVTVVPNLDTGLVELAYVTDLGGNVYRINIGDDEPEDWTMTKIADLGCSTTVDCSNNRKFMFAPDVVSQDGAFYLMFGSGDREKPLLYGSGVVNSIQNYFFMIIDKPTNNTWLSSETINCGSEVLCLDSLLPILTADTPTPAALAEKKGWYLGLRPREQVVTTALTIYGVVSFSTHSPYVPVAGQCGIELGTTRLYSINFENADSENGTDNRSEVLPPVGLPPSPVGGLVVLDNGKTVPFCIGCNADSPLEAEEPTAPPGAGPNRPKNRVYWYLER